MTIEYNELRETLEKSYGQHCLEKFQIYERIKKRAKKENLSVEEIDTLCSIIYQLLTELLGEDKTNEITIGGFCELFRLQYKGISYKDILETAKIEDGYQKIKSELSMKCSEHELVFLALRSQYDGKFVKDIQTYIELRRMLWTQWANITPDESKQILDVVTAASKTVDIGVSTTVEFVNELKKLRIPAHEIVAQFSDPTRIEQFITKYYSKKESIDKIQNVLSRIRYTATLQPDKEIELPADLIISMEHGQMPNISKIIKVVYMTNTTLEYIFNGKLDKVPYNRPPIDELLVDGNYQTEIFLSRVEEFCRMNDITQAKFFKDCGIGVQTYSSWKQEQNIPSTDIICQICEIKHLNIDYMLGLTNIKEESFFVTPVSID